jgi:hypothetical protein
MSTLAALARDTTVRLDARRGEEISDEALQLLVVAVVRRYAHRVLTGDNPPPPVPSDVELTGTEALLMSGGLLRSADVSAFELAMMTNL